MPSCTCAFGFVCEDHPDQAPAHDGCAGAGAQCRRAECPWWIGPYPEARLRWQFTAELYESTGPPKSSD